MPETAWTYSEEYNDYYYIIYDELNNPHYVFQRDIQARQRQADPTPTNVPRTADAGQAYNYVNDSRRDRPSQEVPGTPYAEAQPGYVYEQPVAGQLHTYQPASNAQENQRTSNFSQTGYYNRNDPRMSNQTREALETHYAHRGELDSRNVPQTAIPNYRTGQGTSNSSDRDSSITERGSQEQQQQQQLYLRQQQQQQQQLYEQQQKQQQQQQLYEQQLQEYHGQQQQQHQNQENPSTNDPEQASDVLDSSFQKQPLSYFKKGRVFKIYWTEPAARESVGNSITTLKFNQKVYSNFRRFVVVKPDKLHAVCVSITTYGGRATTKPGINVAAHSIIYTGPGRCPDLIEGENKLPKRPIKVDPNDLVNQLDPKSRYCGPACQHAHWAVHKADCKSPLGKESWVPGWCKESRTPAFVGEGGVATFGGGKYLWGNVPAFDVLQLAANEGGGHRDAVRLLFAGAFEVLILIARARSELASGDLRNVVETIAQLPRSYGAPVHATINDRDLDIVARNAIILLLALVIEDGEEAVDCIIHVWYSALIRKADLDILHQRIRPLVQSVCEKSVGKDPHTLLAKTWTFGQRSLRLLLEKAAWDGLFSFLIIPPGLTAERANQIRRAVTLAASRRDYRDRNLILHSASRRIAMNRFREDGILLPFGSPRSDFQEPNPTLFQTANSWPMHDDANPLNGWPSKEVEDTSSGAAKADIYGKLFYHVRAVLRAFLLRLSGLQVSFRLLQSDASELYQHVESDSFNRIEVSNISDEGYLGMHRTLYWMVPLLQAPRANPHATLITLCMNTVAENLTRQDEMSLNSLIKRRVFQYLPPKRKTPGEYDPEIIKVVFAQDSVATFDHIFDRVVKEMNFDEAAQCLGAAAKEKHTVIEKWPFRLKLRPGQPGAQEEFDRNLRGGVSGKERYMEWKRIMMEGDNVKGS
ncbi:MAG: hypothetical protein M1829_001590 [Trizodia sp. TS-e1964]|nr:MAG: hypothetical protein M1829_001590 [Trizodia sp. TS-e1964]